MNTQAYPRSTVKHPKLTSPKKRSNIFKTDRKRKMCHVAPQYATHLQDIEIVFQHYFNKI